MIICVLAFSHFQLSTFNFQLHYSVLKLLTGLADAALIA